ncbi:ABC transporter B family member 26, chloroplastic [Glycine soja]|uniref:ABC transporter B family member 26, chloroplastic n=1 Tax=Glycine soja TaxID=3848 RepID=A0A0B2QZR5_GLYSO|nr:ABC transporter B family member 26, chloroplastic [Glycine soja]
MEGVDAITIMYKWWLEKLANISLRQSAAYGVWNFSFNILYHSTQVSYGFLKSRYRCAIWRNVYSSGSYH